jgi:hypothetical protein
MNSDNLLMTRRDTAGKGLSFECIRKIDPPLDRIGKVDPKAKLASIAKF